MRHVRSIKDQLSTGGGGGGGAVDSVFGRTGNIIANAGDYDAAKIDYDPGGSLAATDVQAALEELDSEKAAASHTHSAGEITAGTLADARISESSVTQHESAIDHDALSNYDVGEHRAIDDLASGTTDLWSASKINTELSGKANSSHTHAAADIVSGAFADARIAQSNVTQHEAAISHNALADYDVAEHRTINDAGSSVTDLWSASKIAAEIAAGGGGGGDVASVFGRTGAVVALASDYDADQVDFTPAGAIVATDVQAAIEELDTEKAATSHTHSTADIVSGTFADARITVGNVTQHQGSIDHNALTNYSAAEHRSINDLATGLTDLWSASKINTELAGKAATSHTHAASDIVSGTFADARIAESSVTQHESAISHDALADFSVDEHRTINDSGSGTTDLWSASKIAAEIAAGGGGGGEVSSVFGRTGAVVALSSDYDADQVDVTPAGGISSTDVQAALEELDTEKAATSHTHSTADVTSGTFADARIAESNVTQHQSALDHDALTNFDVNEHRALNDAATTTTNLWSGSKISGDLAGKAPISHTHVASDITSGTFADARIAESNVTQHQAAISHDSLADFVPAEHIDWTNTSENLDTSGMVITDTITEHTSNNGVIVDGCLVKDGTVDGRDVSVDGTKLDTIETGAEVNDVVSVFGRTGAIVADQTDYAVYDQDVPGMVPGYESGEESYYLNAVGGWAPVPVIHIPVSTVFGRDGAVAATSGDYDASQIDFTPAGAIAATDVQAAIEELDTEKASTTHVHLATEITSGTFADARVAASNVTQHEGSINHDNLSGFVADEHLAPMKGTWWDNTYQALTTSYATMQLDSEQHNTGQFTHSAANEEVTIDETRDLTVSLYVETTKNTSNANRVSVFDIEIDSGSGFSLAWRMRVHNRVNNQTNSASTTFTRSFTSGDKIRVRGASSGTAIDLTYIGLSIYD